MICPKGRNDKTAKNGKNEKQGFYNCNAMQ